MAKITIDGISVETTKGATVLDMARYLGLDIPTLCFNEGLTPWGGCRLCVVEIGTGENTKLFSACTYPATEGLVVKTATKRVVAARKMVLELLIAQCPTSKILQDLAAKMGMTRVRFSAKDENCIYCGLCVRICEQQMMAKAIGFTGRGDKLNIATPFNKTSPECRRCGGCIYVCPACTLRCEGVNYKEVLCGRCENTLQPTCLDVYEDTFHCWMGMKGDCGTCVTEKKIS